MFFNDLGHHMRLARRWLGIPAIVGAVLALAIACGSSTRPEQQAELHQTGQALGTDGLDFYLNFPESAAVGNPTFIGAGVYYYPPCDPGTGGAGGGSSDGGLPPPPGCDTATAVSDVTFTQTVTGTFSNSDFYYYGPAGFTCSETDVAGGISVTCHADSLDPYQNGNYGITIVPSVLGETITTSATLTAGGVEVRSESRQMSIVEPSADLAVWAWGGGTALLGQTAYTSFFLANNGPVAAANPKLTLTLNGPGVIDYVNVWYGTCTWTDTTATCTAPDFPVFWGVPVDVGFHGTALGQVSITASISSDTPDAYLDNNVATSTFDILQPKVTDIAVTITDAPDPVKVGKPLTYNITVTNNGPDTAEYVYMSDFLPYDTLFSSVTTTQGFCYGGDWGYLQCDLGPMASGLSANITVVVTPQEGGTISNYVYAQNGDWLAIDPDWSNNSAVATTTVKGPNPPVTVQSYSDKFFVVLGAYVDCANDFVLLEGYLHTSYQIIYNKKTGFYQVQQIFNPEGLTGEGLNTGDTYHATGMTRQSYRYANGFPNQFTFENNFRIIGEKTGNDLLVHMTTVVTFNPDGSVASEVNKYSFECK